MNYEVSVCKGCQRFIVRIQAFNLIEDDDGEEEEVTMWTNWVHIRCDYNGHPWLSEGDQFHYATPKNANVLQESA